MYILNTNIKWCWCYTGISIYGTLSVGSAFGAILLPLLCGMVLRYGMAIFSYCILTAVVIATIILCIVYIGYVQPLELLKSSFYNTTNENKETSGTRIYNKLNLISGKDMKNAEADKINVCALNCDGGNRGDRRLTPISTIVNLMKNNETV